MDDDAFPVSNHADGLPRVGLVVQIDELLLLLVVVDGGHNGAQEDGHEDGESFYPRGAPLLSVPVGSHGHRNRYHGGHHQDLKREVVQGAHQDIPETLCHLWWRHVGPVGLDPVVDFFLVALYPLLHVHLQSVHDRLEAC